MLPRHVVAMLASDGWRPSHPGADGATSEKDYAGLKVRVLSAPKAAAYRPGSGEVAISITGRAEPVATLSRRFEDVLRLAVDDTGAYASYAEHGQDNPGTITREQADAVAEFVLRHRDSSALVVHCTAGVSRSRSLAAAVCTALALPYEWTIVNDDVHRAVALAFQERSVPVRSWVVGFRHPGNGQSD